MKVLVACEESQEVAIAFRRRGIEAWSCDILPCSGGHPEWHIMGDARQHLGDGWHLLIAHPPCTRLCNSGVRWLRERNLWADMDRACRFFNAFRDAPVDLIAVENPIPHRYAVAQIGEYSQIIQPWQFGHPETKSTCLWLKGLPPLEPTNIVTGRAGRVWRMPPSAERGRLRSKTYPGIAAAMADQWSKFIQEYV